ncbi:hypothetical protein D3C73_1144550 [compost metagenome]
MILIDGAIACFEGGAFICIDFGISGMLHGSNHVFVFFREVEGVSGFVASLLEIGVSGENFPVEGEDERFLKNRFMGIYPANSIFNGGEFTVVSCGKRCDVSGIDKAGCNIGAAYQFNTGSFIQLVVSGAVSEEPDG